MSYLFTYECMDSCLQSHACTSEAHNTPYTYKRKHSTRKEKNNMIQNTYTTPNEQTPHIQITLHHTTLQITGKNQETKN